MNRFEVLGGQYTQDGKVYRKGQVVLSPHSLDTTFPHHFRRLGPSDEEKVPVGKGGESPASKTRGSEGQGRPSRATT